MLSCDLTFRFSVGGDEESRWGLLGLLLMVYEGMGSESRSNCSSDSSDAIPWHKTPMALFRFAVCYRDTLSSESGSMLDMLLSLIILLTFPDLFELGLNYECAIGSYT